MADLIAILNQSANGLAAFRAAAQTAGHNMQNVNTPGYSRQRVELEALGANFLRRGAYLGQGVGITAISQSRDLFLERQIPEAIAGRARYEAESGVLRAVSALDPEMQDGLVSALGDFYSKMRALAQNPADLGLRQAVLGSARNLSLTFNRTGQALSDARTGVDAALTRDVDDANQLMGELAALNASVAEARGRGAEPNDLLDKRLLVANKLSELTGATSVADDDGNLNMVLASGGALVVGNRAAKLGLAPDATNDGHLEVQITRIGASQADGLDAASFGGKMRGLLDARDGGLADAQSGLDQLAFDLGSLLNTQHQAGFDLNGATGQALFSVGATADGAARAMALNPALVGNPRLLAASSTAAGVPGNGLNLQALIATETTALSSGEDPASTLSAIVSGFGTATRTADALAEQEAGLAGHLERMRESVSGVSIDEEMVAMMQAQRAFEAVSKVVQTADEMLGVLMTLK